MHFENCRPEAAHYVKNRSHKFYQKKKIFYQKKVKFLKRKLHSFFTKVYFLLLFEKNLIIMTTNMMMNLKLEFEFVGIKKLARNIEFI